MNRLARLAGAAYIGTIVFGSIAAFVSGGGAAVNLLATACYVVVTAIFYILFKPVGPSLSLLAALFSLTGCALSALAAFQVTPVVPPLALFGVYCLLIGFLIVKSDLMPKALGVSLAIGGLGWLTFAVPPLAKQLVPFNMIPGILAETALALWLLVRGVRVTEATA